MGLAERIPGKVPGKTLRNISVGTLYIVLWPYTISIGIAVLIGRNQWSIADRLALIPGIAPKGGRRTTVGAAIYIFLIHTIVVAVAPAAESPAPDIQENTSQPTQDGGSTFTSTDSTAIQELEFETTTQSPTQDGQTQPAQTATSLADDSSDSYR